MTASVFHATAAELAGARIGSALTIVGPEARHAVSVVRLGQGEQIELVDGVGRRVRGTVASVIGRDTVEINVTGINDEPAPEVQVTVVQSLPKGDHAELAVDLMTQVGVDVIVPWAAQRSVAQWRSDRIERAHAKWVSAASAASKQSRRARTPVIGTLAAFADVCDLVSNADIGLVLHEEAEIHLFDTALPTTGDVVIIVGPEGGLSDDERAGLRGAGAVEVCLGPTVLRSSLAGAVAVTAIAARARRPATDMQGSSA